MLIISNMGDQVWLITSRHTEPDLQKKILEIVFRMRGRTYNSSIFGWKMRFTNPILGDL